MSLTDAQIDRILAAIREKTQSFSCQLCGTEKFSMTDRIIPLPARDHLGGGFNLGGMPSYPSVGLICEHCGNTLIINLGTLGLKDLLEELRGP